MQQCPELPGGCVCRAESQLCVDRIQNQDTEMAELGKQHAAAVTAANEAAARLNELQNHNSESHTQYAEARQAVYEVAPALQQALQADGALLKQGQHQEVHASTC